MEFISAKKKKKRFSNITSLVTTGMPKGRGRKGEVAHLPSDLTVPDEVAENLNDVHKQYLLNLQIKMCGRQTWGEVHVLWYLYLSTLKHS